MPVINLLFCVGDACCTGRLNIINNARTTVFESTCVINMIHSVPLFSNEDFDDRYYSQVINYYYKLCHHLRQCVTVILVLPINAYIFMCFSFHTKINIYLYQYIKQHYCLNIIFWPGFCLFS